MADSSDDGALQALWQSQSRGEPAIAIEDVREWARRLERRVARRNRREYIVAVVVVLIYGWTFWRLPFATVRIGAGLMIAATIFVCYRIHVHGSAVSLRTDVGMKSSLDFFRAQLERQRDLLQGVWRWALLPFVPGFLVLMIAYARAQPARVPLVVAYGVSTLILMLGLHVLNRRAAARIQRVLDRLKHDT